MPRDLPAGIRAVAVTHYYIPAFTTVGDEGQQEAVCGEMVSAEKYSLTPTCRRCQQWLRSWTAYPNGRRGMASMSPDQRRWIAKLGNKAIRAKGLEHRWTPETAAIAGRLGGLAAKRRAGAK